MALTKEDLQAIADLMDSKIQASETRMLNRMDQVVRESEIRVINHVNAVVENTVQPSVKQIADGHKMLYEKMERRTGRAEQHTSGSGVCAHPASKASLILGTIERMATE